MEKVTSSESSSLAIDTSAYEEMYDGIVKISDIETPDDTPYLTEHL